MKKKITILSIISFLIIVIDRVVKILVTKNIPYGKTIDVIPELIIEEVLLYILLI